ncbi:replication factor C small subunit [Candidatus Woesearchaeota archaeon]|nr:replication factor C small subunit [Candidatus Woesearchaeota archaeon]
MTDSFLWAEKYRPKTFEEFVGQTHILDGVRQLVEQGNLPHVMFAGPAGVGKSTLAIVVARTLFGDRWRQNVLELNASDERGIDVVRTKVKNFARTKAFEVPFKIIFLDECDALTRDAQQALRRTMENFSNSCRFVLSCNFPSKIIDPIQSRCVNYRFKSLTKEDIFALVDRIAKGEGLKLDADAKESLFACCEGDCRRVVNLLQAASTSGKTIDKDKVESLAGLATPQELPEMLSLALKGDLLTARKHLIGMLGAGLSGQDLIKLIQKGVWELDIDDKQKLQLVDRCGECEFRLVEGSDSVIQLEALLAQFGLLRA